MDEQLKQCPFCSGKAHYTFDVYNVYAPNRYTVQCVKCFATLTNQSKKRVFNAWNKRK